MIETSRLTLRPMKAEDEELLFRLYSDEEILRYSPFDTMDRAAVQRHLQRILREWEQPSPANYEFAAVRKSDGVSIGRCHTEIDPETDTAMIGCHLLQTFWRQGFATEICRALMDHSFEHLNVHRVNALCNPENLGSRRMLEACGLRLEAHFRKSAAMSSTASPSGRTNCSTRSCARNGKRGSAVDKHCRRLCCA